MAFGQAWTPIAVSGGTGVQTTNALTTTSGSTILVAIQTTTLVPIAGTITDSKGNTYTFVDEVDGPVQGRRTGLYYKENIVGGAGHTISCADPNGDLVLLAVELTSMQTASFDVEATATGTGTALSASDTSTATDTLVGIGMSEIGSAGSWTPGGSFTQRAQGATALLDAMLQTRDGVAAGSISAAETYSISQGWVMRVVAFKESSGPPPPVVGNYTKSERPFNMGTSRGRM